jgi:GT2 family glycosyltransferase
MIIPKIIHQLWIGPLEAPCEMMKTWKEKHPDFEYIFWNEREIEKRGMVFNCQSKINIMKEINGKADIMRWEILFKYGGYFIDADSICIEPFDDFFNKKTGFATYENEIIRSDLIATGTMGFVPGHRLCKDIIDWINTPEYDEMNKVVRAWGSVGPGLLTKFLKTGNYKDFAVYPSHCFLPIHFTGLSYKGHKKVYAYQAWGTANKNYDKMNTMTLPPLLREPVFYVSILIPVRNTPLLYLSECLESIKCQNGYFGIELVCVNDGSDEEHSRILECELDLFKKRTRFCKVVYEKLDKHYGVTYAQNKGVLLCSNELIFRMDSDDIMLPDRITTQIDFMKNNPDCVICGSNIQLFYNDDETNPKRKTMQKKTNHPQCITWEEYIKFQPSWFMNQPTFCMRKSAVLMVGNYNVSRNIQIGEDYELELRLLHRYGKIYNIPDVLVYYRVHPNQLTHNHDSSSPEMAELRKKIIDDIISQ